ncbi:hypothetical protein HQ520_02975, partial [bacterium]|nr:hypothetical protein [bacterium]
MSPEKPVPETRPLEAPVLDRETRTPMTRMAKLEVSRVFAPEDLKRALHCLADCGWNAVVLPGVFEGYPIFFSQVWADYGLRRQHPKFRKWNPFEIAFEVASKRGFEVLVSHEPYVVQRLAHRHTSAILRRYPDWEAKRHPKRKKRRAEDTQKGEMFYCPVNRDYRRFLSSMLHVLLEEYPIHGLVLDLRHYPFYLTDDNDYVPYCYCDACRDATLRDLGFDPISVDFESEKGMVRRWREWQSEQMDNALRYIRARALKARTSMRVIGLLTSDVGLAATHRAPLIHWRAWIDRSLVEALTLDRYTPDLENFESQILHDLETLPDNSLLLPMLPRQVENGDDFLQIFRALPLPG